MKKNTNSYSVMNNEFVSIEMAQKLKEKGFSCKHPFAMYDEGGKFHPLYTSADYYKAPSGFEYRCYYDFDDFNDEDTLCPTIEQVLRWLRNEKNIYCLPIFEQGIDMWLFCIERPLTCCDFAEYISESIYDTYEQAAIAGIDYVIGNLI